MNARLPRTILLVFGLALAAAGHAQVPNPNLRLPAPAAPAKPAAAAPALAPADPQQAELNRLKAEGKSLAGQVAARMQEVRGAQQAQWRGSRRCQGPLVVWDVPPQAGGASFPRTAYDCSPYLCEAPGMCMAQCAPGQCAPGAVCVVSQGGGGVCVPR